MTKLFPLRAPHSLPPRASLSVQETLVNRELSQLEFNQRVLAQAKDPHAPLLERLRFLCIFSSNMDEFFEIRMAGLKEKIKLNINTTGPDCHSPVEVYTRVSSKAHALVGEQYHYFNNVLVPALSSQGICFMRRLHWTPAQSEWIKAYFFRELMPVLTPIGLDPAHPFPRVLNKSLNFAVQLAGRDAFGRDSGAAIVQAPRSLPRVIRLPQEVCDAQSEYHFIFLSSVLHAHVGELFAGMTVQGCYQFRVTRNSELFVNEEEITNLRDALQGGLPQRHFGDAVRLEVADNCPQEMTTFLQKQFRLESEDIFHVHGPVNLVRLLQVPDWVDRPDLKYPPFMPGLPKTLLKQADIFCAIREQDILLHHPYQSFAPVIEFIQQAAQDSDVLAIKHTIYRAGHHSALLQALIDAAQNGKEVTVVVELFARSDEETNLSWSSQLEAAGAQVVYGVVGYKTHCKMALVVRRETGKLKRYVHLGTGNYHDRTTKQYTDFGLLTCNLEIANDVARIFTELTGLGHPSKLTHLLRSPFTLHQGLISAIQRETEHALAGRKALIIAKMNALLEPKIIEALYDASCAGVKIHLIIRSACALRPGVKNLSENIKVYSIIGRFLEHSRIFYFFNDQTEDVYLSSADWMGRNFFRRIEVCFPILDRRLKTRVIREGLKYYLRDNVNAWTMDVTGGYRHRYSRSRSICAQTKLVALLSMPHAER